MLKSVNQRNALFLIFLLALILRVYTLSSLPQGFHADEARLGWNALSIIKTGKDDRGNFLPLYYNTFGDFRPTGIFYITAPFVLLLGNNEFAVRLPSALIGALTIFPLYFFVDQISKKGRKPSHTTTLSPALISALFLAISPWHAAVSRSSSEVIISIFFSLFALVYFSKAQSSGNNRHYLLSFFLFFTSYLFYHSIRILAPLFIATFVIKYQFSKKSLLFLLSLILLTAIFTTQSQARGRFSQVSIFNDLDVKYELSRMPFEEGPNRVFIARLFHNKPLTYSRKFISEYSKYFSADFLISDQSKPARYRTVGFGLIYYLDIIFIISGLYVIIRDKHPHIFPWLLLISPIPAALTTEDSPNLHRSLYMIIFLCIIAGYGLFNILKWLRSKKYLSFTLVIIQILNIIFFVHMYQVHSIYKIASSRNYGAKELSLQLIKLQPQYDKIIITNIPDDPYPWIAFFGNRSPEVFNHDAIQREHGVWQTENFVFQTQRCPSRDAFEKPDVANLLVVDARGCESESNLLKRSDVKILSQIKEPDESVVYTLWSYKKD